MDDAEHYTLGYNDYWFGLDEPALTHYHYMQGWMAAFMEHCHHEHGIPAPTKEARS